MQTSETIAETDLQDLVARAEEYATQRDFPAARTIYQAVLPKLRADHPVRVRALVGYAWTLQALGDHEAALHRHEEALDTQLSISSEGHSAICTIRQGLGATLIALGQLEAAQDQYVNVLSVQRNLLDRWHPDLAATLAAEVGMLAFKEAFATWVATDNQRELGELSRTALDRLHSALTELD